MADEKPREVNFRQYMQGKISTFSRNVGDLSRSLGSLPTAIKDIWKEPPSDKANEKKVLEEERKIINAARQAKNDKTKTASSNRQVFEGVSEDVPDYIGLAFSGGGIRSATFNLGVLQVLAKHKLLRHVDYLSTVSGGGYIGSWLVAWLKRLAEPADSKMGFQLNNAPKSLRSLEELLAKQENPVRRDPEPIRHLRRYSNYLTPNASLLSADTWTLIAIWTRNLLLNLSIIICLIAFAMLIPRFAGLGIGWLHHNTVTASGAVQHAQVEPIIAFILLAWCALWISYYLNRSCTRARQMEEKTAGMAPVDTIKPLKINQTIVQLVIVVPLLLASCAITNWMYRNPGFFEKNWYFFLTLCLSGCFFIITAFGGFAGGFARRNAQVMDTRLVLRLVGGFLGIPIALASGFMTAAIFYGLSRAIHSVPLGWKPWAYAVGGPPAVLMAFAVGVVCLVGLMGREMPDSGREWLGRLRAWSSIYAGGWIVLFGASIFGPWLIYKGGIWAASSAGSAWLLTTIGGLFAGNSAKTNGTDGNKKSMTDRSREALAVFAPYVFMAGLFVFIALGIHELAAPAVAHKQHHDPGSTMTLSGTPQNVSLIVGSPMGKPYTTFETRVHNYAPDLADQALGYFNPGDIDILNLMMLLFIALGVGLILAWRVDINEFSMHHFYKNRLVRAYLGASRKTRNQDAFTGFDKGDDFPLASLSYKNRPAPDINGPEDFASKIYCGPYPIINGALNLAGANALAWQERKAASFIFTPLYSGYELKLVDLETGGEIRRKKEKKKDDEKGNQPDNKPKEEACAYLSTDKCGDPNGILIGTAMAISGAAANPNSGYHTSAAVAFFLSVLNARLGWWLGNPASDDCYYKSGPRWGLPYLLVELFGQANKNKAYVSVSDGGHFENLGIYELVRRRCKYIIACDAEQDSGLTFGGIASAIRKCYTDFGVEIDIDLNRLRLNDKNLSAAHCAIGTIHYGTSENEKGYLVYLKSSLTGDEDSDVLEYRSRDKEFPHQSTADQWFDESQFESYRKLGFHIAENTFGSAKENLEDATISYQERKEHFFCDLKMMHYPLSKAIGQSFTKHTDHLTRLLDSLSSKQQFAKYDKSILNKWSLFGTQFKEQDDRQAFYWCTSMLQLMEDVYIDLNFQDKGEREHPENAGWMQLFRNWSVTPLFRKTWEISGSTYGTRFQRFFEDMQEHEIASVLGYWFPEQSVAGIQSLQFHAAPTCRDLSGKIQCSVAELKMENLDFNGATLEFSFSLNDHPWTGAIRFIQDQAQDQADACHSYLETPQLTLVDLNNSKTFITTLRRGDPADTQTS